MRYRLFSTFLIGITLLSALNAEAALVTYSYTGNTYTNVSGPYTTADRVTAKFTVDLPTISNLSWASYKTALVGSLVMSDGARTLSWPGTDPDKFPEFRFATDSQGIPTEWQIAINSIIGDNSIFTYTSSCVFSAIGPACDFGAFNENNPTAFVSNDPGIWTIVPVPIPPAVYLFVSGILGLFGLLGRKKGDGGIKY